jgi:hypothetical protein
VTDETGLEGVYDLEVHGNAKNTEEFLRMLREQTRTGADASHQKHRNPDAELSTDPSLPVELCMAQISDDKGWRTEFVRKRLRVSGFPCCWGITGLPRYRQRSGDLKPHSANTPLRGQPGP